MSIVNLRQYFHKEMVINNIFCPSRSHVSLYRYDTIETPESNMTLRRVGVAVVEYVWAKNDKTFLIESPNVRRNLWRLRL